MIITDTAVVRPCTRVRIGSCFIFLLDRLSISSFLFSLSVPPLLFFSISFSLFLLLRLLLLSFFSFSFSLRTCNRLYMIYYNGLLGLRLRYMSGRNPSCESCPVSRPCPIPSVIDEPSPALNSPSVKYRYNAAPSGSVKHTFTPFGWKNRRRTVSQVSGLRS